MRSLIPWWCWLVVLGLVAGCSGSNVIVKSVPQGQVSGRVLFKDQPLPGGMVIFHTEEGTQRYESIIDENGNYKLTLPTGPARIAVDNRMVNRAVKGVGPRGMKMRGAGRRPNQPEEGPSEVKGRYISIPIKYHSPDTSGLTYAVESGSQTHDIPLD